MGGGGGVMPVCSVGGDRCSPAAITDLEYVPPPAGGSGGSGGGDAMVFGGRTSANAAPTYLTVKNNLDVTGCAVMSSPSPEPFPPPPHCDSSGGGGSGVRRCVGWSDVDGGGARRPPNDSDDVRQRATLQRSPVPPSLRRTNCVGSVVPSPASGTCTTVVDVDDGNNIGGSSAGDVCDDIDQLFFKGIRLTTV